MRSAISRAWSVGMGECCRAACAKTVARFLPEM